MSISPTTPQQSRRGNALVLAASVLVLLVIIATTFVSRTQTGRATAAAVRKEAERQDSVDGVGEDLAQLVANALFVRPVDAYYYIPDGGDELLAQGLVNALPGEPIDDDDVGIVSSYALPSSFPDQSQGGQDTQQSWSQLFPGISAALDPNRIRLDPSRAARDSALTDRFAGYDLGQRYGVDPWFPGNFAPFEVVPSTNWPDGLLYPWSPSSPYGAIGINTSGGLIFGDGTPSTFGAQYNATTQQLFTEGNPVYGPGFGDTRWLRDLEPMSVDQPDPTSVDQVGDGLLDSFFQWRHLTNISTPENGWRVVFDISDVFGAKEVQIQGAPSTIPNLVGDLSVPVEQWIDSLDYPSLFINPFIDQDSGEEIPSWYDIGATGALAILDGNFNREQFEEQWARWSSPLNAFDRGLYFRPPANLFDLNDLDADGQKNEPGERPTDRFVGLRQVSNPTGQGTVFIPDDAAQPDGSMAWNISRYLDDSDGDGWTDSFWFLAPGVRDGVRNIVSVSITDNGGRLDLSTATRYAPGFVTPPVSLFDASNQLAQSGTTGFTPADLALVSGFNANSGNARGNRVEDPEARVGFFDAPIHREGAAPTRFDPAFEPLPLAFPQNDLFNDAAQDFDTRLNSGPILTWLEERGWLQAAGLDPDNLDQGDLDRASLAFLSAEERLESFTSGNTPPWSRFDLASELELRANESLNTSDVFTRAEKAAGTWRIADTNQGNPLRGNIFAEETTPFLDGLTTYEWKADLRHRSTVVSNTRNDLLPSWLRWRFRPDTNADGFPDTFFQDPDEETSERYDLWQLPGLQTFLDPDVGDFGAPNYSWLIGQRTWLDRNGAPYIFDAADAIDALPGSANDDQVRNEDLLAFTENFIDQQSIRLDLREENPWFLDLWTEREAGEGPSGRLMMSKRLPHAILHALSDSDVFGTYPSSNYTDPNSLYTSSYFGSIRNGTLDPLLQPDEFPINRSEANTFWLKLASAGLSANILSYRDNDWFPLASDPDSDVSDPEVVVPRFIDIAPLYDQYDFPGAPDNPQDPEDPNVFSAAPQQEGAVPLPRWGYEATVQNNAENENLAMLGLERQPFLVEAFIGSLYATRVLDGDLLEGIDEDSTQLKPLPGFYQADMRYLDGTCNRTTVVAVQIANPFDKPIPAQELEKYRISVSGRHFPLQFARPDLLNQDNFSDLPDEREPLEPATENRPSSAIFFLCEPDWDNAWNDQISGDFGDDTNDLDTLFKERMIDWLDLACEQDLNLLDNDGDDKPDVLTDFDLDHPAAIPDRWGRGGTIRYRVPSLQEFSALDPNSQGPYAEETIGWSSDPAYYQRWLAQNSTSIAPYRDDYDQSRPSGELPLLLDEGERIVELSRIDHDASLRAAQVAVPPVNLDTDNDGYVDTNLLNHPNTVWVVIDRFDSRELPLAIDEPIRGNQPIEQVVPSHANDDLITRASVEDEALERAMEPLSMWGSLSRGFGSALLPIDMGPGAIPQLPRLTLPWTPLDGNELIDVATNSPLPYSWIPGIFFPNNTRPFDTLINYASARRAWGWDADFEPTDPRTWGVQSQESHPRFTSAIQFTVQNSSEFQPANYFPDSENPAVIPLLRPQGGYPTQVALQGFLLGGDPANEDSCTDAFVSSPDGCLSSISGGELEWCAIDQRDQRNFTSVNPQIPQDYRSKPTRFSGNRNRWKRLVASGINVPYWADKSFYHTPQPFQLVHKDDDFQQIGEVLNIPLVGHLVDFDPFRPFTSLNNQPAYRGTIRTFSEFLAPQDPYDPNGVGLPNHVPVESSVERLLLATKARGRLGLGRVIGAAAFRPIDPADPDQLDVLPATSFHDPHHAVPALPAGERLLDLFVVDGPGFNFDNQSYFPDVQNRPLEPGLSRAIPGLVNINTAPTEVMRSIPGWYRTLEPSAYFDDSVLAGSNRTWFAESVRSWRDRSQRSDLPQGNAGNTFASAANFSFERAYTFPPPATFPGFGLAGSFDVRLEDLTSNQFNLIPDPAFADDARPFGFNFFGEPLPAPVKRSRGFASIGGLRSVDMSVGLQTYATPVDEFASAWPEDLAAQESTRNAQAGSAFTLGSYQRNRQPLSPYRSLQDRDQSLIPFPGGQPIDLDGDGQPDPTFPGVGPLGRTFPSPADANLAEDPGFGLSVPYDVAGNGTPETFDTNDDGFGDSYVLNQDSVSGDMEDANLLVAAASNVVSTRSDTFTVHFRVRSFKQNPQTLVWDATDPEFIVGESRYVMVVDRSQVNRPGDEPRILMLAPVRN